MCFTPEAHGAECVTARWKGARGAHGQGEGLRAQRSPSGPRAQGRPPPASRPDLHPRCVLAPALPASSPSSGLQCDTLRLPWDTQLGRARSGRLVAQVTAMPTRSPAE